LRPKPSNYPYYEILNLTDPDSVAAVVLFLEEIKDFFFILLSVAFSSELDKR
jgi:hypothetical protein